jgi:hypothetical protein
LRRRASRREAEIREQDLDREQRAAEWQIVDGCETRPAPAATTIRRSRAVSREAKP